MSSPALLYVHAHPDDEALFTAGTTAHYARRGVANVLVTCTLGQLGIDPQGRAGDHLDHDDPATAATRARELREVVDLLGFTRHVTLGYRDSGMAGWTAHDDPGAFVRADLEAAARVVAALIDEVSAAVVVTYDEYGFYGHPDHVMAHRVARRAVELSASAQRLVYPVMPSVALRAFVDQARAEGVGLPAWVTDAVPDTDLADVAWSLDVSDVAPLKQRAIATHASQVDNADLVSMSGELFSMLFGTEHYRLGWSRDAPSLACGDDLLGGLT